MIGSTAPLYTSMAQVLTGYLHPQYCASLGQHGKPIYLRHAGSHLIERPIPGTDNIDAMGCYPLLCCENWRGLNQDLEALERRIVSLTAVTDPFGDYSTQLLEQTFDRVQPFKDHYVVDLHIEPTTRVSKHHRRETQRSLKMVEVEYCPDATTLQTEWIELYTGLIERHRIQGMSAFSPSALEQQLTVPGMAAFRAQVSGETVGIALWYLTGQQWYYHLAANSELGYRHSASYALVAHALNYFAAQGYRWVDLGAGAGIELEEKHDGLARFKAGWATTTKTAYLCGKVLDPVVYQQLVQQTGILTSDYFPAYRHGEFG